MERRDSGRIEPMARKQRVDILLVEKGLVESRSQAQRLVMAGKVRADGELVHKPSFMVGLEAALQVEPGPRFVSRGGEKLLAALEAFPIAVSGRVCADVGSSTGGFTDCLLQHGAQKVYAIDVGRGLLHWRLRGDARVILIEGTNARYLEALPERVGLVTSDVSFISLTLLLGRFADWLEAEGDWIGLVKPQFEAGRAKVGKGGVVRDEQVRREVVERIAAAAGQAGLGFHGLLRSPVRGPKGNVEFLIWCRKGPSGADLKNVLADVFRAEPRVRVPKQP